MNIRRGDAPTARHLAMATAVLLPLLAWWVRRFPDAPSALFDPCLLRHMTGVPCPTCGGTRALVDLAHGRLLPALAANPLVTAAALVLAAWALGGVAATLVPRWRLRIHPAPGDGRCLAVAVAALVAADWLWVALLS